MDASTVLEESPYSGDPYSPPTPYPGEESDYRIGEGVRYVGSRPRPYERRNGGSLYRPLRIYSRDAAVSRLEGAVATVAVPYEPLLPGPRGVLLEVDDTDDQGQRLKPVNLDLPELLLTSGRAPSPSDPQSHQQMVYAICSLVIAAFRSALGRQVSWGFAPRPTGHPYQGRLVVRPHALPNQPNAYYDPETGELLFGYYRASPDKTKGRNLPGGWVFPCLSHDIVAHEVTHALLDGLRSQFALPTGSDVMAFHEGFADLVALFQHFSYMPVVEQAIRKANGDIGKARELTELAVQLAQTASSTDAENDESDRGLRSAIGAPDKRYTVNGDPTEPHARGALLVAAVFDAYLTVFRRKAEKPIALATSGSGVLPPGALPIFLQKALAHEASQLAQQFLNICIRAIDYCPPIDITFGEYLRALITADYDLVPDDPYAYREALVDAFRQRGITPQHVSSLSEDALLWRPPTTFFAPISTLAFRELRFEGDPGTPADQRELYRQACALGYALSKSPELRAECGVVSPCTPGSGLPDSVDLPIIESVRSSRRIGPDGQVVFDLIAEVTQRRIVAHNATTGGMTFPFYGGATLILGPQGELRYVVRKRVDHPGREVAQREFLDSEMGRRYWEMGTSSNTLRPRPGTFRLLHTPTEP